MSHMTTAALCWVYECVCRKFSIVRSPLPSLILPCHLQFIIVHCSLSEVWRQHACQFTPSSIRSLSTHSLSLSLSTHCEFHLCVNKLRLSGASPSSPPLTPDRSCIHLCSLHTLHCPIPTLPPLPAWQQQLFAHYWPCANDCHHTSQDKESDGVSTATKFSHKSHTLLHY